MNADEYIRTFVIECRELLEDMEAALLRISQADDDPEIINSIFRAAHTIKGSAGLFGLDFVVNFTHAAESVLDRLRSGELAMSPELSSLLIEAHDHLGVLVDLVAEGEEPSAEVDSRSNALIARMKACLGQTGATEESAAEVPAAPNARLEREQSDGLGTDHWHLSLRFGTEVFRNGMDPYSFVRYLASLGRIVQLVTIIDAIPAAEEMDPESCYLGLEISFASDADKVAIEQVFDFVRSDCLIHILPPHSKVSEYQRLIQALPEEDLHLGEILVKCGTLTPAELESILRYQTEQSEQAPAARLGEMLVEHNWSARRWWKRRWKNKNR